MSKYVLALLVAACFSANGITAYNGEGQEEHGGKGGSGTVVIAPNN